MAVKIKFDSNHNVIPPTFVLATRSGKKMNTPIPAVGVSIADHFNDKFELNFSVSKYDNGKEYILWDKLQDFKLCWCKEWDVWFEMYVEKEDDYSLSKHITLVSLGEAELSQINLYNIEINTEDDILRDDYEPSVLYNPDNPKASILDRLLDKAPHYSIEFVDTSIMSIQRSFSFNDTTIYDAFQEIAEEIDCIFVINSGSNSDGSIKRSISVYDLESYCFDCGNRGHYTGVCSECGSTNVTRGYGEDTTIFVSIENLADDITLSTDYDSVKNCFRLEAGDDLMTATVIDCNPNGSQYLWYITDDMKEDMSDELVERLEEYDETYAYYQSEYPTVIPSNLVTRYNMIIDKYSEYQEDLVHISSPIVGYSTLMNVYYDTIDLQLLLESTLMPTRTIDQTDAEEQAALLTRSSMSPVSVPDLNLISNASADNAVLNMAKILIDPRFKVKVLNSSYNSTAHTWTGNFSVENYSDEDDTATSATINIVINDNYENFLKQQIDKTLKNAEDEIASQGASDIVSLFKLSLADFKTELTKYCLSSLDLFEDSCQKCLEVLQAQGVADNITWADKNPNLYQTVYVPYYNKLLAIQEELQVREDEIAVVCGIYDEDDDVTVEGVQTYIIESKKTIQEAINLQNYLGEDLWLEFIAYRREDTYSNDNYISDGLNNAEQFARALEFIKIANEEIYKSATLQHSLSASLQNLLVMKEFEPLVDHFAVGNWIRVKIDGEVFRLRLITYEIDFDNLAGLSVEFSDVKKYVDGMSDSESIMNQAQSMASSYGSVSRQASNGNKGNIVLENWVQKGLDLTKLKIVDDVDNQTVSWDEHGFLCREFIPFTDTYDDRQLKIINNGLYITDNNWRSIKTAVGKFYYTDPTTGQITEAYGVNGETIVGKLLIGEQLGIYNSSNSLEFNENGLKVTNGTNSVIINANESSIFKILKGTNAMVSLDASGNLVLGNISGNNLYLDNSNIKFRYGSSELVNIGTSGMTIKNSSGTQVASFNSYNIVMGTANTNVTIGSSNIYLRKDDVDIGSVGYGYYINNTNLYGITLSLKRATTTKKPAYVGIDAENASGGYYFKLIYLQDNASISGYTSGALNLGCNLDANGFNISDIGYLYASRLYIGGSSYYIQSFVTGSGTQVGIHTNGMLTTGSNLYVGNVDYGKTLNVNGSAHINTTLSTGGACTIGGNLTVNGKIVNPNIRGEIYSDSSIGLNSTGSNDVIHTVYLTTAGNFRLDDDGDGSLGLASYRWTKVFAKNGTIDTSDRKEKDNIEELKFAYDLIMSLEPVSYMWKSGDHRRKHMGFIAQEASKVCNSINENLAFVTASYKRRGGKNTGPGLC